MPSLKSARQRAKFENLSEGEKVERLAKAMDEMPSEFVNETPPYIRRARIALAVMEGRKLA